MFKEGGRGKRTSGGIKSVKPQETVGNANDGAVFNEVVRSHFGGSNAGSSQELPHQ